MKLLGPNPNVFIKRGNAGIETHTRRMPWEDEGSQADRHPDLRLLASKLWDSKFLWSKPPSL